MIAHPRRGTPILAVVRRIVDRRHKISRSDMATILAALQTEHLIDMDNGWGGARLVSDAIRSRRQAIIAARDAADADRRRAARHSDPLADIDTVPPSVRDADLADLRPTATELADGWARCCTGIQIISVLAESDSPRLKSSNSGSIRYDEPGSMHPQLRATLMFVAAGQRTETLDYLSARAKRVLIVTD